MLRGAALCIGVALTLGCGSEIPDPYLPLLAEYTGMPDTPVDTSNAVAKNPAAAALGKKFYFDADFSGREVYADMLLRPMTTPGRAQKGAPIRVSCNSCHDVTKGGSDQSSDPPGNRVSFGAGAYDVSSQQTINSAYTDLVYWNGRNDSLWSQIVAVGESHVSVNGSRLRTAWRIADAYRAEYQALFPQYPLPAQLDTVAAQQARLESDGSCKLAGDGSCPADFCHMTAPVDATPPACMPRFPLEGRPGYVRSGELSTCAPASADDILQPYDDAWDCMDLADQLAITRVYTNWAKAIAAYEYTLVSKDSPFDKWADGGFTAGALGASAERGARLFVGKAACKQCHTGPLFTDNLFHQIGVPQVGAYVPKTTECPAGDPWCDCASDDTHVPMGCLANGARDGLRKLQANKFRRDSVWSDDAECARHYTAHIDANYAADHPAECDGRVKWYAAPLDAAYKGAWKTPGLRDVALTAPYMHQGMYTTLRDVIVHYNKGGMIDLNGGELIGTIDDKIKPLNLTDQEIDDLVAFLQTLTGQVDPAVTAPPTVPADSPF